jgi:signal peptidase I
MDLNFEVLLVLATMVTGVLLIVGRLLKRRADAAGGLRDPWWVDFSRSIFPVLLIVLVVRSFVVEPFRIPSSSMLPTLLPGDFILVSKFSYGVRLPVNHLEVIPLGKPKRGDLAVFRYPLNPAENYIKRVVGLPGDRVLTRGGRLYINGQAVSRESTRHEPVGSVGVLPLARETLDGRDFDVVFSTAESCLRYGVREEFVVPDGQYFAIGDNRSNSADSRCWGAVAEEHLVGRAFLIWMSWDSGERRIAWDRIGTRLR